MIVQEREMWKGDQKDSQEKNQEIEQSGSHWLPTHDPSLLASLLREP